MELVVICIIISGDFFKKDNISNFNCQQTSITAIRDNMSLIILSLHYWRLSKIQYFNQKLVYISAYTFP